MLNEREVEVGLSIFTEMTKQGATMINVCL